MNRYLLAVACLPLLAQHRPPLPSDPATLTTKTVIAIVNAQLVPMDRQRVLTHHTVIIRDGKIAEISAGMVARIPADAGIIDAQGQFLMPGLCDTHVHLTGSEEFPLYLAAGVTSVINMAGGDQHLAWRDKVEKSEILGPHIYTTGPMVAGIPLRFGPQLQVHTQDEARKAVADQKKAGYDFIKVYDGLSAENYRAIMAAARAAGIHVIGHIPESVGMDLALAEGQYAIEHAEQVTYRSSFPDLDFTRIGPIAEKIEASGIWLCPTLAVIRNFADQALQYDAMLARPEMRYVGRTTIDRWKRDASKRSSFSEILDQFNTELVRECHRRGVPMLAGTDTPNPLMIPGFSLVSELQSLVSAGLTPYEALRTATVNAGAFVGANFGTIEAGRRADLILVRSNPFADVANVSHPSGVMILGRWYAAADLKTMLEEVAPK